MGFKHLFGFALTIAGSSLIPLFFLFLLNKAYLNPVFLFGLAIGAVLLLSIGLVILNKTRD